MTTRKRLYRWILRRVMHGLALVEYYAAAAHWHLECHECEVFYNDEW